MRGRIAVGALLLLGGMTPLAHADEAGVRQALQGRFPHMTIESVAPAPFAGLYEVVLDGEIVYTDEKAEYFFAGSIYDIRTLPPRNLTQDNSGRMVVNALASARDSAIKRVKGDGKRILYTFEDPNCGYCKRFRATTLAAMDNVTVYTFMYNILSPDSFTKSQNIWCSADRNKAWDDWMLNGKAAAAAPNGCTSPNDKVLALGQKMSINGTPAIFFADGSRIAGAVDQRTLEAKFATIK